MGVEEALSSGKPELAGDLAAGVEAISSNQTIKFTKYIRLVLPLDGYVFWVRADMASPSAIANAFGPNAVSPNTSPSEEESAPYFNGAGSLHYATDNRQTSEGNYDVNRVVFTSQGPINQFNQVGPNVMWVGEFQGVKFGFSARKSFYQQSGLHHYVGDAVYAIMKTQLVDDPAAFKASLIVSNSLPIWLSMNDFVAVPWVLFSSPPRLYPAYLSPEELVPPYGTIDVVSDTDAIGMAPHLAKRLTHTQLVRERVRVTLWGLNNARAMDFIDFVNQYSLDSDLFGVSNMPAIRDVPFKQVELGTLAQKKFVEYDINYNQRAARDVARQLILKAVPSFRFFDQPV